MIRSRRKPRAQDVDKLIPIMAAARPLQMWDESAVEAHLQTTGVHRYDDADFAYCHLTPNELLRPLGSVPVGWAVQVSTLAPQHHDQAWVDNTLAPLLGVAFQQFLIDFPAAASWSVYAFLPPDLIQFWDHIFVADVDARSSGSHVISLPTLAQAMARLK